jgi:uncharacterized protein YyaL (SSP411 family)
MTVFLTPDRKPFHAGTYFPPVDRHGMPAFRRVLAAVVRAYREKRSDVAKTTDHLTRAVREIDRQDPAEGDLDVGMPARAADALMGHVDDVYGGLGSAPKFPNAPAFRLLLRRWRATGRSDLEDAVVVTCRRMAEGGMYDHIGGGFHRYSVDQRWLVPHFEKMLYDNAQIPQLYLEAWQATGEADFMRVVEQTLDYVLGEMRDPAGGFYSASDADSEGEEGRFFVWTPDQVARLVPSEDAPLVCRYWDITAEGNFEGKSIAHVTISIEQVASLFGRKPKEAEQIIDEARRRLYAARARRVPPLRDEKILASWNGLMVGMLARAGRVFANQGWIEAAQTGADFLWGEMRQSGRLLHTWYQGRAKIPAFLDDHVFVAGALIDLYEATGAIGHLDRARALVGDLDRHFHDPADGGYFFAPDDGETLLTRSKPGTDGSLPSGNGAAASLLLRLHALTGDDGLRDRAEEILRLYHGAARENAFGFVAYLEALELWADGPTEIVLVGPAGAQRDALARAAAAVYLPGALVVTAHGSEQWLPAPARERPMVDGRATAYVCRGFTCSAPVTSPDELIGLLEPAQNEP